MVVGGATSTIACIKGEVPLLFRTESLNVVVLEIFWVSDCPDELGLHACTNALFAVQPGSLPLQKKGVGLQFALSVTGPPGGDSLCGGSGGVNVQEGCAPARVATADSKTKPQPPSSLFISSPLDRDRSRCRHPLRGVPTGIPADPANIYSHLRRCLATCSEQLGSRGMAYCNRTKLTRT